MVGVDMWCGWENPTGTKEWLDSPQPSRSGSNAQGSWGSRHTRKWQAGRRDEQCFRNYGPSPTKLETKGWSLKDCLEAFFRANWECSPCVRWPTGAHVLPNWGCQGDEYISSTHVHQLPKADPSASSSSLGISASLPVSWKSNYLVLEGQICHP